MKKFSLKGKGVNKNSKSGSSLGGIPLKGAVKSTKPAINAQSNNVFGDKDVKKQSNDVPITCLDDIKNKKAEPLVIKLVEDESSWEYKRKLIRERRLKVGVNNLTNNGIGTSTTTSIKAGNNEITIANTNGSQNRSNYESLPDPPTKESYERVPVSMFGMAMLRGMGWTPQYEAQKTKHQV